MSDTRTNNAILKNLAKLGGKEALADQAVDYSGMKFVVPELYRGKLNKAAQRLMEVHEQLEDTESFNKSFDFHPFDGAYMFALACKESFGMLPNQAPPSMFRPGGTSVTVNISPDESVDVPWGEFNLPILDATVMLSGNRDGGFAMSVYCPKKYTAEVHGLFTLIEELWKQQSIYRNAVIDAAKIPNVIDLRNFDPQKVVYSADVFSQLEANVWSPIRYTQRLRELGQPLKRAILLEGTYGTGKTLAGMMTGLVAKQEGWTYIACKPSEGQDPFDALRFARQYQPCVVFIEDVDTIAGQHDPERISRLLDEFDGIKSKNTELFVVMTTNHADKIHKGMLRPGRLDAVIHISPLDREAMERFVYTVVGDSLADEIDFDKVHHANRGYTTAFVKEGLDRAVRHQIARTEGRMDDSLTTVDLVNAAEGLRPHLELMNRASESVAPDPLTQNFVDIIRASMDGTSVDMDDGEIITRYVEDSPEEKKVVYRSTDA